MIRLLCLLVAAASPLNAANVLIFETTAEIVSPLGEEDQMVVSWTVTLAENQAVLERSGMRCLYRTDTQRIAWLFQDSKSYIEAKAPIDLEALFGEEHRATYEQIRRMQTATVQPLKPSETAEASWSNDRWKTTQKSQWRVVYPLRSSAIEVQAWQTEDPAIDANLLHQVRTCYEAILPSRPWFEELGRTGAVPVRTVENRPDSTVRRVVTELLETRQEDISANSFEIPEGYQRIPFRPDLFVRIR